MLLFPLTRKDLLLEAAPFAPALLMRAVVTLEKARRERWDRECLDAVLQAAALDMHAVEDNITLYTIITYSD